MDSTILCLLFLLVGFILGRIGVKSIKENTNTLPTIKLPNLNPINVYKEHKQTEEEKQKERELNTMLENINNYDGSSYGQKDI